MPRTGRPKGSAAVLTERADNLRLELRVLTAERAEAAIAHKVLLRHYREAVRMGASPLRVVEAMEKLVDRELARVRVAVPLQNVQLPLGLPLPLEVIPGGASDPEPPAVRQERVA